MSPDDDLKARLLKILHVAAAKLPMYQWQIVTRVRGLWEERAIC